jgi:hypothetical protein
MDVYAHSFSASPLSASGSLSSASPLNYSIHSLFPEKCPVLSSLVFGSSEHFHSTRAMDVVSFEGFG